jgi:branched-chain amino acid transport system permease protein
MAIAAATVKNEFVLHVFIMIFTSAALGLAWNLIGGYAGQLSLGHAAFYGIGAYTSTLLFLRFGVSPWIGMIAGGALAAVASVIIGLPCFRLRGAYFTLATIAFAEVLRILCVHFRGLTEGSLGIALNFTPGFSNLMFSGKSTYAFIALGLTTVVYYLSVIIENTRLGYYLIGIKENQEGTEAMGVNSTAVKLIAFAISAFITAVVGTFFAQYILFIDPESEFSILLSIFIALPVMIGGIGTALGPVIGAFIITPLRELPSLFIGGELQGLQNFFFGVVLILVVLRMPEGLMKWIGDLFSKPAPATGEDT